MSATTGVADDQYPFCHPAAEVQDQVVLLPLEERGGGWRDIKTASIIRMVEMITTLDYHGIFLSFYIQHHPHLLLLYYLLL